MMTRVWLMIVAIALVSGTAAGISLGYHLGKPVTGKAEPPAAAIRQQDQSYIPPRIPNPAAKPRQIIPQGAVVERISQVQLQPFDADPLPTPGEPPQDKASPADGKTKPLTLDLTQVLMPDQTRRMIFSSPDGLVSGGFETPVTPIQVPRERHWAIGLTGSPIQRTLGVWVDYTTGPWVTGGEALRVLESPLGCDRAQTLINARVGIQF